RTGATPTASVFPLESFRASFADTFSMRTVNVSSAAGADMPPANSSSVTRTESLRGVCGIVGLRCIRYGGGLAREMGGDPSAQGGLLDFLLEHNMPCYAKRPPPRCSSPESIMGAAAPTLCSIVSARWQGAQ